MSAGLNPSVAPLPPVIYIRDLKIFKLYWYMLIRLFGMLLNVTHEK